MRAPRDGCRGSRARACIAVCRPTGTRVSFRALPRTYVRGYPSVAAARLGSVSHGRIGPASLKPWARAPAMPKPRLASKGRTRTWRTFIGHEYRWDAFFSRRSRPHQAVQCPAGHHKDRRLARAKVRRIHEHARGRNRGQRPRIPTEDVHVEDQRIRQPESIGVVGDPGGTLRGQRDVPRDFGYQFIRPEPIGRLIGVGDHDDFISRRLFD